MQFYTHLIIFLRVMFCYIQYLAGNGRVTNPWKVRTNDFETFGLDLAGADTANTAAYLRKNDSFEVVFNANQASVVVRCFNDSFTPALDPDTLCGKI